MVPGNVKQFHLGGTVEARAQVNLAQSTFPYPSTTGDARLEELLAQQPRSRGNWSIPFVTTCKCELCADLTAFLVEPNEVRKTWPLAKDGRAHVHGTIDQHELPVSHATEHVGNPHRLVLVKTDARFTAEARTRKEWAECRAWLAGSAAQFV